MALAFIVCAAHNAFFSIASFYFAKICIFIIINSTLAFGMVVTAVFAVFVRIQHNKALQKMRGNPQY